MSIKISKKDEEIIKFFFSDKVREFQIDRICNILKIHKEKKTLKIINDIIIQHNKDLFRKYFKLKPKNISLNDYLKRLSLKTIYDCIPIINQYIKQNQIKRYNDFNDEEFAAFGKNDAFISASGERYNQMPNIDMTERPILNSNLNNKYGDVNEKFNQLQNSYQQQLTTLNAPPQNRTFTNSYNPQQLQINPQQQINQPINQQMNLTQEQLRQMAQNPEFIKNMFADKNYTPAHQDNQQSINIQQSQQMSQQPLNIITPQEQQTQDTINQLFAGLTSTDILNGNGLEGTDLNTVYNQTLISEEEKQKFSNNQVNIDAALNRLQSERNQLDNYKPQQQNQHINQSFFEQQGVKGALNKETSLNDDDIYNNLLEQPTNIFNILKNVYNKFLFIIKDNQKINIKDISDINDFNLFNSILHNKNLFLTQISPITLHQINNALNYFNPLNNDDEDDIILSSSDDEDNIIDDIDDNIDDNTINNILQNNLNKNNLKNINENKNNNKEIKKNNNLKNINKNKEIKKENKKSKEILLKISSKSFNENIKKSNHFTIKFNNKNIIKKISIKNIIFKNKIINENLDINDLCEVNVYNNNFKLNFDIKNNLDINNIINEINNNKENEFIGLELNDDKTVKIFSFDEQNFIINNQNNSIFKLLGFIKPIYKDNNAYISEKSINLNDLSDTNTEQLTEQIIKPIIILTINNNKKFRFKDLNNKDIPYNNIINSLTFDIYDENNNYYDMIDYITFDLSLFV